MVFAAREPGADFVGLPELVVEGLRDADARELLASVVPWPLDEQVRERILAETRGIRWRCWSCRVGGRRRSWRAGSRWRMRCHCRGGSRSALVGSLPLFRRRRGSCCSWRRPIRSATRRWCGGRRRGLAYRLRPRRRRSKPAWSSSLRGYGSVIRWCARRPTGPRRSMTGSRYTAPWQRSPMRRSIRIAAPGIGPGLPRGPTRMSLQTWSVRPGGRRRVAAWPRRPPSSSVRRR